MKTAKPALLVLGWGNLSRGDDALGPRCVADLCAALPERLRDQVEFLDDYQLQVEFVLDLVDRKHVLFIDASVNCASPFEAHHTLPRRDTSFSSHSLSPQALLQVYADMHGHNPPSATVLKIRAESFELGAPMSAAAEENLEAATLWALKWIEFQQWIKDEPVQAYDASISGAATLLAEDQQETQSAFARSV